MLSGKHVLVTGADGFIGSHLVEGLLKAGARVRALVLYNAFGQAGWLDFVDPAVREAIDIVPGDVRDPHLTYDATADCDVVMHLAALITIQYSYLAPDSYFDTNVRGTLNVLQAARRRGIQKVIHTSTSEVYGTAQYVPIDEQHPLNAQSPYAASKIAADQMALAFHRSFDLPVTVVRPFNSYGPRQTARAIIPTIISQVLAGEKDIRLGNITPTRDFTYVTDLVDSFIAAAATDNGVGEIVHVGTGSEISVGELARKIAGLCDADIEIVTEDVRVRPEKSEVDRLVCDCARAAKMFNWKPKTSLDDGLQLTIDWLREHRHLPAYAPERYFV